MDVDMSDDSYLEMTGLKISLDCLETYLEECKGRKIMSNDDVKLSVLALTIALEKQLKLNHDLIVRVQKLERKKSKFRFWKN